jgi:DNA-binding CsgD family transcriptional regulator
LPQARHPVPRVPVGAHGAQQAPRGEPRLTPAEWGADYVPTIRQRQIVCGISFGWKYARIADTLGVTVDTVKATLELIRSYVGRLRRPALVARFFREGWID